jgi:hypothetical protein
MCRRIFVDGKKNITSKNLTMNKITRNGSTKLTKLPKHANKKYKSLKKIIVKFYIKSNPIIRMKSKICDIN